MRTADDLMFEANAEMYGSPKTYLPDRAAPVLDVVVFTFWLTLDKRDLTC